MIAPNDLQLGRKPTIGVAFIVLSATKPLNGQARERARNIRVSDTEKPPILSNKHFTASSAFTPESLLREARRQKGVPVVPVPEVCILDPDGDIVRYLHATGRATRHSGWACYHTDRYAFRHDDNEYGIVGCAVGAAFAVLIAEELFASGCRFLISVTSAGQILPVQAPPYFIVINRALRDEGTSYHYMPPSDYSEADAGLVERAREALMQGGATSLVGPTWTTDAPFGRRVKRLKQHRIRVFSLSKWRPPRSMRFQAHANSPSCVSRTSPTRWAASRETSKRERPTVPKHPSALFRL